MTPTLLCLLSPYRLPTRHALQLDADEVSAWLNGYLALWHPAALADVPALPRVSSSYEYDQPTAGQVFAIPATPPLFQPDDWPQRRDDAGAVSFAATADRAATDAAFLHVLGREVGEFPPQRVLPFRALGLGYLVLDSLFEAMDHQRILDEAAFLENLRAAAREPSDTHLKAAAEQLLNARETLSPMTIHWLDLALLGEKGDGWPAAFERRSPVNLLGTAAAFAELPAERRHELKERLAAPDDPPTVEVCSGAASPREDALLPFASQIWSVRRSVSLLRELFGVEPRVYARPNSSFVANLPTVLHTAGPRSAVFVPLDGGNLPTYRSASINWSAPDGKQIDALTRPPLPADQAQTAFNLAYHLHEAIRNDSSPTVTLLHKPGPADAVGYDELLTLHELAPVFGRFTTLSAYFGTAMAGEYVGSGMADDFTHDELEPRVERGDPRPVSAFAVHARDRRRLDAAFTFAALRHALGDPVTDDAELENAIEAGPDAEANAKLSAAEMRAATELAERLLRRGGQRPGWLVLNPCGFTRRVGLELPGVTEPIPAGGPVLAAQTDADATRVVVEVPGLGFAFVPRGGDPLGPARAKMTLGENLTLRNEFLAADIDPASGGLRIIRDARTGRGRLAQQLAFNPGSRMVAKSVTLTHAGPALGEIVAEGELQDEQGEKLAGFRQRYRVWLGRPVLEVRIELEPVSAPAGYPWHAYYAARFAWRDEAAALCRGLAGHSSFTQMNRPVSSEYVELHQGDMRTAILTGGLPFHQKHSTRMLDVLLLTPGETARTFELALGVDRDPAALAQGVVSPVPVVPVVRGPAPVGASGWLFHLDSPNVLLLSLRLMPGVPVGQAAVVAHLLETGGHSGPVGLRCPRAPRRACVLDADDGPVMDLAVTGDQVELEMTANEFLRLRIDW